MNKQKIDPRLSERLFSSQKSTVLDAINEVKVKGNKLYLPLIFELLNKSDDDEVKAELVKLLGTVKDKDTVSGFIDALTNKSNQTILKEILTACWQNGLDFSTHMPVFIDLIIDQEWEVAFEAFTVIDNLEFLPDSETIEISKSAIIKALPSANEQKSYFLKEILTKLD